VARLGQALVLASVVTFATSGRAQPFSPTINPNAIPITVSNQPEKIAVRPKVQEQTLINIALGATANGGNTESYAATLGGRIGYLRTRHQLTIEALGSMGRARQESRNRVDWTSRNAVARLRYDIFVAEHDALFVAIAPRRDAFAGLDLRLQNQIGYLRNLFFFSDAHRFWSELGYDFTYDNFSVVERTQTEDISDAVRALDPALVPEGSTVTRTTTVRETGDAGYIHSARVFLGYTNRLFASANLSVGVETLLDFQDKRNVRVNGLTELTSSITHSFKLGIQARILFDNVPVPGTRPFDTVAALQLVYTFDSLAGALNAPCPVCDCTSQVNAARASCRSGDPLRQIAP
jgi:putative salt-induced outer membrane protein YdiY